MKDGAPLQCSDTTTTVCLRNGMADAVDGPFAETKVVLGGCYILECKNLDKRLRMRPKFR